MYRKNMVHFTLYVYNINLQLKIIKYFNTLQIK